LCLEQGAEHGFEQGAEQGNKKLLSYTIISAKNSKTYQLLRILPTDHENWACK
jgi:hypothetical protein